MYLQPEELKTDIDNNHDTGIVPERLGGMLLALADGVFWKYGRSEDRDNAIDGAVFVILKAIGRIDTDHKPFNYLRHYFQVSRKERNKKRCWRKYAEPKYNN
jgi:hypothetical protein